MARSALLNTDTEDLKELLRNGKSYSVPPYQRDYSTQKLVEVHLGSSAEFVTGAVQPQLIQEAIIRIPVLVHNDVAMQQHLVAEIEAEQTLVATSRELITRLEHKIRAALARLWDGEQPMTGAVSEP